MPDTLTLQAKYDQLVERIVEAVPDVLRHYCVDCGYEENSPPFCDFCDCRVTSRIAPRPITLEDVLRVPSPQSRLNTLTEKQHALDCYRFLKKWHLGKSLSWHLHNAPETIDFIHSLLFP